MAYDKEMRRRWRTGGDDRGDGGGRQKSRQRRDVPYPSDRKRRTRRCTITDGDNAPINHDGKNSAAALVDDRRRLESCASTTWASAMICRHLVLGAAPPMVMAAVIANESQSLSSMMMPPAMSIVVTSWLSRLLLPSPPSTLLMRSFCGGKRQVPSDSCLPPSRSPGHGFDQATVDPIYSSLR